MCNSICASGDIHKIECELLASADFEVEYILYFIVLLHLFQAEIKDYSVYDDHYACIMPIRYN